MCCGVPEMGVKIQISPRRLWFRSRQMRNTRLALLCATSRGMFESLSDCNRAVASRSHFAANVSISASRAANRLKSNRVQARQTGEDDVLLTAMRVLGIRRGRGL